MTISSTTRHAAAFLVALLASTSALPNDVTVRINGRPYLVPSSEPVLLDGEATTIAEMTDIAEGLQLSWSGDAGPRGNLPALIFSHTLIGPVTAVSPLEVLGQALTITADTELEGIADPDLLEPGAPVAVAGTLDANGSLQVSLLELREAPGQRYLLAGNVRAADAESAEITIGNQRVALDGVTIDDCLAALPAVGEFVELRADAIPGFVPGNIIDSVTDAACVTPVPPGTVGAAGFMQGIVISVAEPGDSFVLGGITVDIDAATVFEFGNPDELAAGVLVEVDGVYTESTRFAADTVAFSRPLVRFEAALQPDQIEPGISLLPFGLMVNHSAQVRDDDGLLANGITAPTQVRIRAFVDSNGALFATRVRERGAAEPDNEGLRAAVDWIDRPRLGVLGLIVDTTSMLFVDADGNPVSADQFFQALQIGDVIDLDGALFDAGTFSGGEIALLGTEARPVPTAAAAGMLFLRSGTAGGYREPELILRDSFER